MATKKTTKKTTTGAKTAKTSAPMETRAKAETKPAAPAKLKVAAKPVVETVAAVVEARPMRVMPQYEVEQLVRQAAFVLAKRRQFRSGSAKQDWLAAEQLVKEQLAARGISIAR